MMKKSICVLLTLGIGLSCFSACGGNGGDGGNNGGKGGLVRVQYFAGGFGDQWLKDIAADYKKATGVTIKLVPSYTNGEIQSLLNSKQQTNDILMPLLGVWSAQDAGLLEDLTSVYEASPAGETVAIKDKMNPNIRDYMQADDGKWYQMNGANSVSTLCYTADTLDKFLGEEGTEDGWEVPNTTDELIELCDRLKEQEGVSAFTLSTQTNYFWDYLGMIWWAQYEGIESFNNYFEGKYLADDGTWQLGPEINDAEGRKLALEMTSKLLNQANGYVHSDVHDMDFTSAQLTLCAQGFGENNDEVAFMVNGDWFENEMLMYLTQKPQDIRMMRPPVLSDLTKKLTTVKSDEQLSAVIDAIDSGADSYENVSEEDFETIKNARLMAYTATPNYPICIPSYRPEKQKQLAKDFLIYLCSERGQATYAKAMSGLTMPYGYEVNIENASDFVKSRIQLFGNDMIPVFGNPKSPMVYRGGLSDFPGSSGTIDASMVDGKSVSGILSTSGETITQKWQQYLDSMKK